MSTTKNPRLSKLTLRRRSQTDSDDTSISINSVSTDHASLYYGGEARNLFHERYQMLSRQRKIVAKSGDEKVVSTYFSCTARSMGDKEIRRATSASGHGKQGPLKPLRGRGMSDLTTVSYNSDDTYDMAGKAKTYPARYNSIKKASIDHLNRLSEKSFINDSGSSSFDDDLDVEMDTDLCDENYERDYVSDYDNDNDDNSSTDSILSELAENNYDPSRLSQPLSPRSRFISSCIREGINPRASLVIRKRMSTHLKLSHLSIGDKVAIILAESLTDLPGVESIDISDNVLTDSSLEPLLKAISTISCLVELNLSSNTIGPKAAKAISDYLSSYNCPLKRLIIQRADINDFGCERLIAAIKNNENNLIEIDLSNNKIGSAEALNTVKPDLVTGADAIAAFLKSPKTKLGIYFFCHQQRNSSCKQ